jgi:hypothetical protein
MDRRRSIRIPENEPVQVTSLHASGKPQAGRSRNISGGGMCIAMEEAIPVSTPVQVEWGNSLLLGEICHCSPEGEGFLLGLKLNHVLTMTAQLQNLAVALQRASGQPARSARSASA